jgi:nicotinate-nucleotide adenylyltransferase
VTELSVVPAGLRGGNKKKIALFGGAFDPIHNGHLATIAALANSSIVDEILVLPSGDRPDKPAATAASIRFDMCKVALEEYFRGDGRIVLSDLHSAQRVGYGTIDVVRYLQGRADCEVFVVIGRELLSELHTWKEADSLKKDAQFLVVQRPGSDTHAVPEGWRVSFFQNPSDSWVAISSTALRRMLKQGQSCAGLMPASVELLCCQQQLYDRKA